MRTTSGKESLHAFIAAENDVLRQFLALLKDEQTSLSSGATENLSLISEQKSKCALQLNSLAAERNSFLTSHGLLTDRSGVEAWLDTHNEDKVSRAAWENTLLLAAEARELNRINGELIKIRLQYNAKALEALQGGSNSLDLYGPDGQSTPFGNRRINDAA